MPSPTCDKYWLGEGQSAEADLTNSSDGDTSDKLSALAIHLRHPPMDSVPLSPGPSKPLAATETNTLSLHDPLPIYTASSGTVTVNAYAPSTPASYSGSGWTCTSQGVCAT